MNQTFAWKMAGNHHFHPIKTGCFRFQVWNQHFLGPFVNFPGFVPKILGKKTPKNMIISLKMVGFGLIEIDESYGPMGRSRKKKVYSFKQVLWILQSILRKRGMKGIKILFIINPGKIYSTVFFPRKQTETSITRNEQQKDPQRDEAIFSVWWLNQPIWKTWVKLDHFPR